MPLLYCLLWHHIIVYNHITKLSVMTKTELTIPCSTRLNCLFRHDKLWHRWIIYYENTIACYENIELSVMTSLNCLLWHHCIDSYDIIALSLFKSLNFLFHVRQHWIVCYDINELCTTCMTTLYCIVWHQWFVCYDIIELSFWHHYIVCYDITELSNYDITESSNTCSTTLNCLLWHHWIVYYDTLNCLLWQKLNFLLHFRQDWIACYDMINYYIIKFSTITTLIVCYENTELSVMTSMNCLL